MVMKLLRRLTVFCPGAGPVRSGPARSFTGGGGFGGGGSFGGLLKRKDGTMLCPFYQNNSCNQQAADHCVRATGNKKHLCAAKKSDGNICAGKHSKLDHK